MTPASNSATTVQIPGISPDARAAINATARDLIVAAVQAGRRVDRLCLVVDGTDVRLEPRATVVEHYRSNGVHRLARALERLQVPRDQIAILIVADEVGLSVVGLKVLGIDPTARHSAVLAPRPAPPLTVVAPAPPRTPMRPAKNAEPATRRSGPKARHATDPRDVVVHRPGVPSGNKRTSP